MLLFYAELHSLLPGFVLFIFSPVFFGLITYQLVRKINSYSTCGSNAKYVQSVVIVLGRGVSLGAQAFPSARGGAAC